MSVFTTRVSGSTLDEITDAADAEVRRFFFGREVWYSLRVDPFMEWQTGASEVVESIYEATVQVRFDDYQVAGLDEQG